MRLISASILLAIGIALQAQSIKPLMSASVNCTKLISNNKYLFSPEMASEGFYENVELLEIDNTLVLRCEDGKSDENGFVDPDSQHSIMFKISNLTFEWIDPVKQEGIIFKGISSNNQLGYDLPFVLQFSAYGPDILTVGKNIKTLGEVRNHDINRLFEIGKEIVKSKTSATETTYKKKIITKHKPELTK